MNVLLVMVREGVALMLGAELCVTEGQSYGSLCAKNSDEIMETVRGMLDSGKRVTGGGHKTGA